MNHGFLILTHFPPKYAYEQVRRLQSENSFFFIHFDKKLQLDQDDKYLKLLQQMPNVTLPQARVDVHWAGFSTLEATLLLLKAGVNSGKQIDYFHFMSGQCMPVKSIAYIQQFFSKNRGKEFLEYYLMPKDGEGVSQRRLDKYHLFDYFHRTTGIKNTALKNINNLLRKAQRMLKRIGMYRRYPDSFPLPYAGAVYWSLTGQACKYITSYVDNNPAFYKRLKFTQSADEMMIQTVFMASPFSNNAVNKTLRFANFAGATSSPHPLTMANLHDLEAEDILFARKFTSESKELLEYLDKNVLGTSQVTA